jgi:hypothetical protein
MVEGSLIAYARALRVSASVGRSPSRRAISTAARESWSRRSSVDPNNEFDAQVREQLRLQRTLALEAGNGFLVERNERLVHCD